MATRSQWIDNDEGLWNWWKSTKLPQRKFIRINRAKIDEIIDQTENRARIPHAWLPHPLFTG